MLRMSTELSLLHPGNFTQLFSCFYKLSLLLEAAGIRTKKGISVLTLRKSVLSLALGTAPYTRDGGKCVQIFLSTSLNQPSACSKARGSSGISRSSPFPLPHCSFTLAAFPLPLKSVSFSCQRERNDKSIQRKRKTERSQPSCVT